MSQSFVQFYTHIVFHTKNNKPLIKAEIEVELYSYLGGILKNHKSNPIQIGGTSDHVHILCTLPKTMAPADLVEEVKKSSSKWIKTKDQRYLNFYWQDGYGIFSVNPTEIDKVVDYINKQYEHHRRKSFQDEFRAFLKKYNVEFDERYVWD